MKTTLEIPDEWLRQTQELSNQPEDSKPWMKSFGKLSSMRGETVRINKIMDEEFGQIEAEDLR